MILGVMISVFLVGCMQSPPTPYVHSVSFNIKLIDSSSHEDLANNGEAVCKNGSCQLEILKESYPNCIMPEVRKAFEHNWKPQGKSKSVCSSSQWHGQGSLSSDEVSSDEIIIYGL